MQSRMLQSVLDSMAESLVAADEQRKFILWNPAAEKIVGLAPPTSTAQQWSAHYALFQYYMVTPFPPEQNPLARAIRVKPAALRYLSAIPNWPSAPLSKLTPFP